MPLSTSCFIVWQLVVQTTTCTDYNLYRPTYHFVPTPEGWMNDPCGPFYDDTTGLYHLFFQYHTPRAWGHAVSSNLFEWTNLPIAIDNDEPYNAGGVWTGSVTQTNELYNNSVYAMYSVSTNDMICLASLPSYNQRETADPQLTEWLNDPENCILNASRDGSPNGRDPTTSWFNSQDQRYYFVYGIEINTSNATHNQTGGAASIWSTANWKQWTQPSKNAYLAYSTIGGIWECPDFFELPKSQQTDGITHVLKLSVGTQSIYVEGTDNWYLGSYNETSNTFIPYGEDSNNLDAILFLNDSAFDYGRHFYASKSFYDAKHDRQLLYGWILEERPINADDLDAFDAKWAGVMSLPLEIRLLNASQSPTQKPRIVTKLVDEFDALMHLNDSLYAQNNITIKNNTNLFLSTDQIEGSNLDIKLYDILGAVECGIYVLSDGETRREYTKIGFLFGDEVQSTFYINTTVSSLNADLDAYRNETDAVIAGWNGVDKIDNVRILVDNSVIVVFVNDGVAVQTRRAYPTLPESVQIGFWAYNGDCTISKLLAWNIKDVNSSGSGDGKKAFFATTAGIVVLVLIILCGILLVAWSAYCRRHCRRKQHRRNLNGPIATAPFLHGDAQ